MRAWLRLESTCTSTWSDLGLRCGLYGRLGSHISFMRPVRTFISLRGCAGWSWSSLVAYLCTVGIAVPQITCFIVHCRYFLCDVAGVEHHITLRFCLRRHLCLLLITSWRSRDGQTLMLIHVHDKNYFVLCWFTIQNYLQEWLAYELGITFPTGLHMRLVKTRIKLCICAVWSESLESNLWVVKDPKCLLANSKGSDLSVQMYWLIWVFAGHKCNIVGNAVPLLI